MGRRGDRGCVATAGNGELSQVVAAVTEEQHLWAESLRAPAPGLSAAIERSSCGCSPAMLRRSPPDDMWTGVGLSRAMAGIEGGIRELSQVERSNQRRRSANLLALSGSTRAPWLLISPLQKQRN